MQQQEVNNLHQKHQAMGFAAPAHSSSPATHGLEEGDVVADEGNEPCQVSMAAALPTRGVLLEGYLRDKNSCVSATPAIVE